jgi:hypothetical protein
MITSNRAVIAAAIIGLSLIIAFWVAGSSFKYRSKSAQTIVVTGLAERDFVSDLIVWNGTYSRKSFDLKNAYSALKQDENSIRQYLKGKGILDDEMVFSSVVINREFETRTDETGRQLSQHFIGYVLSQTVKVESKNVDRVDRISREITELIQTGIEFNSSPPAYYYSKLGDIKIDLLGKASSDAKNRAESIAKNAGANLGKLIKANMGVFQITGRNSNEDYSYGGAFNLSDRNKTGSITIKMEFATD